MVPLFEYVYEDRITFCSCFIVSTQGHYNYDKTFASEFKKFLSGDPNPIELSTDNKQTTDYMQYIEDHLKMNQCPSSCCKLW